MTARERAAAILSATFPIDDDYEAMVRRLIMFHIQAAEAAARADEREACAKVADAQCEACGESIALAIRNHK